MCSRGGQMCPPTLCCCSTSLFKMIKLIMMLFLSLSSGNLAELANDGAPIATHHLEKYISGEGNATGDPLEPMAEPFSSLELKEFQEKTKDVLVNLKLKSVALMYESSEVVPFRTVLEVSWDAGTSTCLFEDLQELERGIFRRHKRAICFGQRFWTVILVGTSEWAAKLLQDAFATRNIYDARIHWVVLVPKRQAKPISLPISKVWGLPFISWLYLLSKNGEWTFGKTKLQPNNKIIISKSGKWKGSQFLEVEGLHPKRPSNYFGQEFRIFSAYDTQKDRSRFNAIAMCALEGSNNRTRCYGYVGEMIDIITNKLNLKIENIKQKRCGIAGQNNTRLERLENQEAEMAAGTCSITQNRLQIVDFSEWFWTSNTIIASQLPKEIRPSFIVFDVFMMETWGSLIATMLAAGIFLTLIGHFTPQQRKKLYSEGLLISYKAFLYQSHNLNHKSNSQKAFIGILWFVAVTVAAGYSGSLTSHFFNRRYETPLDTIEELVRRKDLFIYVRENDPNHQMILGAASGPLLQLKRRIKILLPGINPQLLLLKEKSTYINSKRSLYRYSTMYNEEILKLPRKGPCLHHQSRDTFSILFIGHMFQRNSYYIEQVSEMVKWMKGFGIISKLYEKFNEPGCFPTRSSEASDKTLNLFRMQGAFWLYLLGMSFATCAFLLELIKRI